MSSISTQAQMPAAVLRELVAFCRTEHPTEACGVLFGRKLTADHYDVLTNSKLTTDHSGVLSCPKLTAENFGELFDRKNPATSNREVILIRSFHPVANASPQPESEFRFAPGDWVPLLSDLTLQEESDTIVGIFHSHPARTALPSPRDVFGAAQLSSHWLWCIVGSPSASLPEIRLWKSSGGYSPGQSSYPKMEEIILVVTR
jgi:proteasome lid subunit RPN8/RPN11